MMYWALLSTVHCPQADLRSKGVNQPRLGEWVRLNSTPLTTLPTTREQENDKNMFVILFTFSLVHVCFMVPLCLSLGVGG